LLIKEPSTNFSREYTNVFRYDGEGLDHGLPLFVKVRTGSRFIFKKLGTTRIGFFKKNNTKRLFDC